MASEYELDLDLPTIIRRIFSEPCMPPFSFRFDLEDPDQLKTLLSSFIVTGADLKFGKELAHLTKENLDILRGYMLSIGYDAEYNLIQREKLVLDYEPTGKPFTRNIPYSEWQITFKVADIPLGLRCS